MHQAGNRRWRLSIHRLVHGVLAHRRRLFPVLVVYRVRLHGLGSHHREAAIQGVYRRSLSRREQGRIAAYPCG